MSQIGTKKTFAFGDGRTIEIETGKLAKQADGSVVLKMGNCMVMATVVSAKDARDGIDFMPLTVEYQEKYASAGKFPGGFFKREARPSEYEILIARLIDRALRPLFPDDYHGDTQMIVNLISADKDVAPDALACFAASTAIAVSDIPFACPVSEVRVARIDGKFVVNPALPDIASADIDMIVAGTEDNIMMVEGEMSEISEEEMLEAIKVAHEVIKGQCKLQSELAKELGKEVKREYNHEDNDADFKQRVHDAVYDKLYAQAKNAHADKHLRSSEKKAIKEEFVASLSEEDAEQFGHLVGKYFHDAEKEAARRLVLDERFRLDGRKLNEIRPIWCEVDYLPSPHGSAVFTRGETQSLTTITLGNKMDEQMIDGVMFKGYNNFILHYNFPPYSTGEARPMRSTSRREIGHGNLAMRALKPMIPSGEDNPYTIRIVSEILESNGSSSMATVCAGTLALMDAGIKIKRPVSGIAMGLITDKDGKYAVLSDILGDEDHLGDMDFKVTGTRDGITACQMDIKVDGLPYEVLAEALAQAREGRHHILDKMLETMPEVREDYKPHVPRIVKLIIPKDMIGAVIGPGGKIVQQIQAETGATLVIDEVDEHGTVDVSADNAEAMDAAVNWVKGITATPEVGEEYDGTIKSVMPYGAFIEFMPGKQGLLHISEISWSRIEKIEDAGLTEGEKVKVKLLDVDQKTGKFKLSRKVLTPRPERSN